MVEQDKLMGFSAQDDVDSAIAVASGELNAVRADMAAPLRDLTELNNKGAADAAQPAVTCIRVRHSW